VLLVSFIADAPWTGMGGWTYEVKAALEEKGYRVDSWFADQFPRSRALGRLSILVFPLVLTRQLMARRDDYDVVILHEPLGFWYGLLRRIQRGLPTMIAMCHNVERHYYEVMLRYTRLGLAAVEPLTRLRAPLMRHWQSNGTIRLADHVLCLSTFDYEYITRTLHVPPSRVTRIVNGVPPQAFMNGQRPSGHRAIWVGGWLDVKGRRILPILWREVRKRTGDATLTLIGTGVGAEDVLRDFEADDRQSITVYPRVEGRDRMRELYASGTAYLMSSLSEGSPLSLLEAMAAGLPVVATAVGGIPDIVSNQANALLFDPERPQEGAELLSRVLTDTAMAQRLSAAARDRARELSWSNTGYQIARVLDVVAGRGT
jgi:glycosyltransferase involved in cell wall biosynthesis